MGKTIERLAKERHHEIIAIIDEAGVKGNLAEADVVIDFSLPSVAVKNITMCFEAGIPVVSGTTGWLDDYNSIVNLCKEKNGAFIYASNYSLGVNLFFELNKKLAKMMAKFEEYKVSMEEIHHTQKLDAPSGTAITLAEGVIEHSSKENWALDVTNNDNELPIVAKRIENVPGTHSVFYNSIVDEIEIKHTAKNRDGFALGSIIAAEWLAGKKGVYSMKDVLGL